MSRQVVWLSQEDWMLLAIEQARLALTKGEVPVGAVIVKDDAPLAQAHNLRIALCDPTAHAEILALRAAGEALGDWRLTGCELYVTLEPCAMCAGAILQARLAHVWFGAFDEKAGCCGSVYRISEDPAFTDYVPTSGGILQADCAALLSHFTRRMCTT